MKEFAENEYAAMKEALGCIAREQINDLEKSDKSYGVVLDSIKRLKDHIISYQFADTKEEIQFFKDIKPKFLKELIYYSERYHLDANLPVGDAAFLTAYYKQELERIRVFFERNQQLYSYYRSGKSYYDELFFLRDADNQFPVPDALADYDPRFSTVHSYKLAKLLAYEMLSELIQKNIRKINGNPDSGFTETIAYKPAHKWTDPKVALVEVVYALHAKGAVDNGNADVKDIVEGFEYIFNIDLGNYYAVFQQNIRLRKRKNRTSYLDSLIEYFERRMEYLDENPARP